VWSRVSKIVLHELDVVANGKPVEKSLIHEEIRANFVMVSVAGSITEDGLKPICIC